MIRSKKQCKLRAVNLSNGFSAIELLITLFIASAFLISGYQLYAVVIKDSGNARMLARAANISEDYLNQYKSRATNPCIVVQPLPTNYDITVDGLPNATVTVTITCPYAATATVSKISVTIKYGNDSPQKEVVNATLVSP
jgi:Tfp pilus assembly protein PilV